MESWINLKADNKNKEWFEKIRDSIITASSTTGSQTEMYRRYKKFYELLNNDISLFQDEIKKICNPLGEFGEIEDELKPYNKLKNKLEVLNGEVLSRPNNHKIVLLSVKAIREKNEELYQKILQNVDEDLQLEIRKRRAQLEGAPQEEVQQIIEQQRQRLTPKDLNYKNFLSELEIHKSRVLQYALIKEEVREKKVKSLKHLYTTDHHILYNGFRFNRPYISIINPLFVEYDCVDRDLGKAEWFREYGEMSATQFLTHYAPLIKDKEVFKKLCELSGLSAEHYESYLVNPTTNRFEATVELLGGTEQQEHDFNPTKRGLDNHLKFTNTEFKAFRKVIFYTYTNEYGDPVTVMFDGDADIIPTTAQEIKYTDESFIDERQFVWSDEFGEYKASILYVPRRYEMVEIEDELVLYREVPFQPDNIDNPYLEFSLSYKGIVVSGDNALPQSLVENAVPYLFQIYAVKLLENKEFSAYQSFERHVDVSQIPDELELDSEGNKIKDIDKISANEIIARKTRTRLYDGGQATVGGLVPTTRGAGVNIQQMGNAQELLIFQNLIQSLDLELGLALGIPPAREAQALPGTNVTDNRQSLIQSSLTTQIYFYYLDYVWNKALDEYLYMFDVSIKRQFESDPMLKTLMFEYVLPDGTKELLEITPKQVSPGSVGLFVLEGNDKMYIDYILNNIHPISQNRGEGADIVSNVVKMISNGRSAEEIDKAVKMYADEQRQRVEEAQKRDQEGQIALLEKQKELLKYQSDLEKEKNIAIEKERNLGREIEAQRFALAKDIDQDGKNDDNTIKMYEIDTRAELEREKMEIERMKVEKGNTTT